MAYAAVVSLVQIIEQVLRSDDQFSIPNPKSQIESLHTKVHTLLALLEKNFHVNDLERQIRDAIYEAEDIIESHISSHLLPSEYERRGDLQKVIQVFDSIETKAEELKVGGEISNSVRVASSRFAPPTVKKTFVGLEDGLMQLKDEVIGESSTLEVVAVVGMGGIGKTTLVNEVFDDPSIRQFFHYRAWATIGSAYYMREILLGLLSYVDPDFVKSCKESTHDQQLAEYLFKNLKGRRYLIVLDNICDIKAWNDLKRLFPDDDNESRIILTTRLRELALCAVETTKQIHQIRFLNKEESWDLLRHWVFGKESCPSELMKIGKKIAENCQGLPLTILTFSRILSRTVREPEHWRKVADRQTSPVTDTDDDVDHELTQMMQILNDEHLPQHLKACFMYMGAFPLNREIPASKIINLWVSEGFLKAKKGKSLEKVAKECLEELVNRSLVLVHKWQSTGGIKTCSVHSAVWFLCVSAAEKDTFFHAINRYTDTISPQTKNSLRRLCIRQNVLFAIKDVHKSLESAELARSLLCFGPDHSYPLHVCSNMFLRVLDVLTVLFYEFPMEILKCVLLRYLALTCNGDIPASIFELRSIQFLIVRRKLSIKSSRAPSYLPIEIWNMKELRHLQCMGRDLPDPSSGGGGIASSYLPNLLTLSNVSGHSCTEEVLERTPSLTKLGIRIELADDNAPPFYLFDHLDIPNQLESFKCVIVNPDLESQVVARPDFTLRFPYHLKKLCLSGTGFPWEDMKIFTLLPHLEVLKLRCYAFRGPEWELNEEEFASLKHLLLEDMDIKHWTADDRILPRLERLVIRHCYSLKEIPQAVGYIPTLQMLELVDCSPSVVDSVMLIKEMQEDMSNDDLRVSIHSSWIQKKLK